MKAYIEERAINIATYIIDQNATVRETAKKFGISKSTVHKDVAERLLQINPILAKDVRKVLDINKSERHIRGGMATKEKYRIYIRQINHIKTATKRIFSLRGSFIMYLFYSIFSVRSFKLSAISITSFNASELDDCDSNVSFE